MKLIHLLWRIIWNIKTIVITLFFVSSVVLNVALFLGGSLYSTINNGCETLTGIQTVGSKHESTIEKLGDDVATERQEKIRFKNELIGSVLGILSLENESAGTPRFDDLQPLRSLPVIK